MARQRTSTRASRQQGNRTGGLRDIAPRGPDVQQQAAGAVALLGGPQGVMRSTDVLAMQRTVGNQTVQRELALGGSTKADVRVAQRRADRGGQGGAGGATVQRLLWTKAEFKRNTKAGALAVRGKTLKQIEKLLDEYHEIRADGSHLRPGPTQDRTLNILHEIAEDVLIWLDTHEGDKSSSRLRTEGMKSLLAKAYVETRELTDIREASQRFMGEKVAPVERTENTLKTQMDGSATSILSRLGPIISTAAPRAGDTAEVEVTVKIPCDPTATAFVGGRFKFAIERTKAQQTKVRLEAALIGGGKIEGFAELAGELGFYTEATGASPAAAMELISYGMYRRFRESKIIPNEVANFIWGGSGSAVGFKRAEKWAAKVERENFKDDDLTTTSEDEKGASVETGGMVGVKAKGGIKNVAEMEGEAKYSTGKKYDFGSVTSKKSSGLGKESKLPTRRGQVEVIGESTHALDLSLGATAGPFKGKLGLGFQWATSDANRKVGVRKATLAGVKLGLEASATLPMAELVGESGLGGYIVGLSQEVADGIRMCARRASAEPTTTSQDVGEMTSMAENGALAITQISSVPKEAFVPKFELPKDGTLPPAFSAPVETKLSISGGYDFTKNQWQFEVKVEYIKGVEVNVGVFQGTLKKGTRILKVAYTGTAWVVE